MKRLSAGAARLKGGSRYHSSWNPRTELRAHGPAVRPSPLRALPRKREFVSHRLTTVSPRFHEGASRQTYSTKYVIVPQRSRCVPNGTHAMFQMEHRLSPCG